MHGGHIEGRKSRRMSPREIRFKRELRGEGAISMSELPPVFSLVADLGNRPNVQKMGFVADRANPQLWVLMEREDHSEEVELMRRFTQYQEETGEPVDFRVSPLDRVPQENLPPMNIFFDRTAPRK